jgi:hypothetical protein
MFSPKDMLKSSIEGEDEHKPSSGEQRIFKRIKIKKNFCYLKFDGGLNDNIVCIVYNNQGTNQLKSIQYAFNRRLQDDKIVTLITST